MKDICIITKEVKNKEISLKYTISIMKAYLKARGHEIVRDKKDIYVRIIKEKTKLEYLNKWMNDIGEYVIIEIPLTEKESNKYSKIIYCMKISLERDNIISMLYTAVRAIIIKIIKKGNFRTLVRNDEIFT